MPWVCLIISLIGLVSGVVSIKWHEELNDLLERDAYKVDFGDYLVSGFGYLVFVAGIIMTIASVYLCICVYI